MTEPDRGLVTGPFAAFLEANRGTINHDVAAASRHSPGFDPRAFAEVLRTTVAPVVDAVDGLGDGFVAVVSQTLVSVALDLCAQRRFEGAVRRGWDRLLPALAAPLTADPRRVVGAVTNALDSLERAGAGRPDQWIDLMVAVAPLAPDPDRLLTAGQVAGWRSGMAAYRTDALELAAGLDPALAAAALGMPAEAGDPAAFVARLRDDPWFDPAAPTLDGAGPRPPVAVGSFRGFGGPFLRPPLLAVDGDRVVATDGEDWFAVFADAFGRAALRISDPGDAVLPAGKAPPAELAGIAEVTSWAAVPSGLVATSALSHAVLFTRPQP
jgi:hypothetical protein